MHHIPVSGRIGISVSIFLAALLAMKYFGFTQTVGIVLAGVIWSAVELLLYQRRKWRRKKNMEVAANNYAVLHELEEEAKRLEVLQAKESGALDRWEKQ